MQITIREEHTSDIDAIHAVTKAAFLNATHTDHTEHFIVDSLRKSGALTLSLVAEDGGVVVGHVAISPVVISDNTPSWFGLGPISVLPEKQGKGIGVQLMASAMDRLKNTGARGCVVLGDPAFYHRFGFEPKSGLTLANVPEEYFHALPFGDTIPQGGVTYHSAFSATA